MKKIFVLLSIIVTCQGFAVSVSAREYSTEFPAYVPISGGAYIETQLSTFSRCTLVFPLEFKDNTFGFIGSGSNLINLSNSTVNGYLYTNGGQSYSVRFSRFGGLEYQTVTYPIEWVGLTVSNIYNTNVVFIDEKQDRQTDNYFFSREEKFNYIWLILPSLFGFLILVKMLFRRSDR